MGGRTTSARVLAAEAQAAIARAKLGGTISELKQRVSPQALAHDAAETLKDKGIAIASGMVVGAKKRPMTVAAIAGSVALLLARRPLLALLHRATSAAPRSSSSKSRPKKGSVR